MEPASIVGLVASAGSLAILCGKLARDIHTLMDRASQVSTTLKQIESECTMLQASFTLIRRWIQSLDHTSRDLREEADHLENALEICKESLNSLEADVARVAPLMAPSFKPSWKFSSKAKAKFLWNEDIMKGHLETVRWQGVLLNLLLSSTQLSTKVARQQIRQVARAASIRHSWSSDRASTSLEMNRVASRRESRTLISRQANITAPRRPLEADARGGAGGPQTGSAEVTSIVIGSVVAATKDYDGRNIGHLTFKQGDFIRIVARGDGFLSYGELRGERGYFPADHCDMSMPLTSLDEHGADNLGAKLFHGASDGLEDQARKGSPRRNRSIPTVEGGGSPSTVSVSGNDRPASDSLDLAGTSDDETVTQAKFVEAVVADNSHRMNRFLQHRDIDIEARDATGRTALHTAILLGRVEALQTLIRHGANLDARYDEQAPVLVAAELEPTMAAKMVSLLCKNGASTRIKTPSGLPFLQHLIAAGHEEVARALIEDGISTGTRDSKGDTPLHLAAALGKISAIQTLVEHGADPFARTKNGDSPLHIAAQAGNVPACLALLNAMGDRGAQIVSMPMNNEGNTPLHLAAAAGRAAVIRAFATIPTDPGSLARSVVIKPPGEMPSASDVRALPFAGLRNHLGMTALHSGSSSGSKAAVSALLDCGIPVTARDIAGQTCLHHAVFAADECMCEFLVQKGGRTLVEDADRPVNVIDTIAVATLFAVCAAPIYAIYHRRSQDNVAVSVAKLVTGSIPMALLRNWIFYLNPHNFNLISSSEDHYVHVVFAEVLGYSFVLFVPVTVVVLVTLWRSDCTEGFHFLLTTNATMLIWACLMFLYGWSTKSQWEEYTRLTPLHYSIHEGNQDIARFLMAEGAPLSAKGRVSGKWCTPYQMLVFCAWKEEPEGVRKMAEFQKMLLDAGADTLSDHNDK